MLLEIRLAVLALAGLATAKEMAVDAVEDQLLYQSGVMHERLMETKMVCLALHLLMSTLS